MNINDIVIKKDSCLELTKEELNYAFNGYLNNIISDAEMTSLLKSICKNHLSDEEIFNLTDIFIASGDTLNLDSLGITVDKHSTGGVGDKTTLIIGPIVAACGVKMPKMSGRALGHTGGTIDKLESIGIDVDLSEEEFIKQVKDINFAIISQTKNLCPLDKKVYALRDITDTTEEIGLIATSIMSKKIASDSKKILIDIKVGQGALVKNINDAEKLADIMIKIGKKYDKEVRCILTKMDNPLGNNIGNSIEILEVIDILKNKKRNNLSYLCIEIAKQILIMAKGLTFEQASNEVIYALESNAAYNKFLEFVKYQNGNLNKIRLTNKKEIYSKKSGYIKSINSRNLGIISMSLGAGRIKVDDEINYNAGIILNKNVGDYVNKNELLCTLYGKSIDTDIYKCFKYSFFKQIPEDIIIKIIK